MLYSCFLMAAGLVALDQAVKFLVRAHLAVGESMTFLPHILQLTYVQNRGAAFSILREHTWLLTLISLVMALVLVVLLARRVFPHPFAMFTLSLVLAGAVGNLIDRALLGFVTDMFDTLFWPFEHFPVFNVADICVVVGAIAFCVYYIFFQKDKEKEPE